MKSFFSTLFFGVLLSFYSKAQVVIYEVYAGGGNIGSYYKNDYVMLYNKGNTAQSLAGWSLQKAQNSTSSTWKVFPLTGSIGPNQYYLIKFDGNTNGSQNPIPTPDFDATTLAGSGGITLLDVDLAVSAGKLALSSATTAFNTAAPAGGNLVDFLGYGTANASEGTLASAMDATRALRRVANGQDTNDNSADFTRVSPNPINIALPVSLVYFKAILQENKQVQLNWETASESNSSHFVIERSQDAIHYQEIKRVTAQGSSIEAHQYQVTDEMPFGGVSYYRLVQIDVDSSSVFYRPLAIFAEEQLAELGVYPNPVQEENVFFIKADHISAADISIYSLDGRMIRFSKMNLSTSTCQISPEDLLTDGIYFVHINLEGSFRKQFKLVVKKL
jgi:hypothetical protein